MYLRKSYFIFFAVAIAFSMLSYISSCTHDDDAISLITDPTFEYGDDVINVTDGYGFDKTHSSVRYETAYLGTSALLTARFNDFVMDIEFDEANPSNTTIMGQVTLSTHNSGEPGRDAGCILGTFDVATSDIAVFNSTSVEQDGLGKFNVTGELTFHGVTAEVPGKLEYKGNTLFDANSGVFGAPLNVAGFVFEFEFGAKTVFGIESGNISDNIRVIASGQFKQPL